MSVDEPHIPSPNGVSSKWQGWRTGDKGNRHTRGYPHHCRSKRTQWCNGRKKAAWWRLSAFVSSESPNPCPFFSGPF